jgi:hypothetical protein
MELTTITLARCTISKNMHKNIQPHSLIIYFLNLKKSLSIPFKYCNAVFNVKDRSYSVAIRFKGMSRYYELWSYMSINYKIEELNYKEGC